MSTLDDVVDKIEKAARALGKELDQACGELVTLSCHRRSGPLARPG